MRPVSTPGSLALVMPYNWDELELADRSLSASNLAHAVAVLTIRPPVPPLRLAGVDAPMKEGQTAASIASRFQQLRVLALDNKWKPHDRIAWAMHELATGLWPHQLSQLHTVLALGYKLTTCSILRHGPSRGH